MPTTATPVLLVDAGYLFWAPLSSPEPTNTVSGSKFTDAWPGAWLSLGATESGADFTYDVKVEPMFVAEFYDAIQFRITERKTDIAFLLANWALTQLQYAMNGGTRTIVSGTGATQLNKFTPPAVGAEVRAMIGWESLDSTARLITYQALSGGQIKTSFNKAPKYATIAADFNVEIPATGIPFAFYTAGITRA